MIIPAFLAIVVVTLLAIIWRHGLFEPKKKKKIHPLMGVPITLLVGIISLFLYTILAAFFDLNVFALAFFSLQSLVIFFILWRYLTTVTRKDLLVVVSGIVFPPIIIFTVLSQIHGIYKTIWWWLPSGLFGALGLLTTITQSIIFALWFKNRKPSPVRALVAACCIIWLPLLLLNFIYS